MSRNFSQGISAVVAIYNESENIAQLVKEIQQSFKQLQSTTNMPFEIIVVDDGSHDNAKATLAPLLTKYPQLRLISHPNNRGQSTAVASGVRGARYPWIFTLDGDGQNDPQDFAKLIAAAEQAGTTDNKSILVMGHRQKRDDNFIRRFCSRTANRIRQTLLKDNCPDSGCGLKLFNRDAFLQLPHFNHMHRFLPALFHRAGALVINVAVNHRARHFGQSKYGINNRLWAGIFDLMGVIWLIKRPCNTLDPTEEQND